MGLNLDVPFWQGTFITTTRTQGKEAIRLRLEIAWPKSVKRGTTVTVEWVDDRHHIVEGDVFYRRLNTIHVYGAHYEWD